MQTYRLVFLRNVPFPRTIKDTGDVYAEASDKTTPAENYFVCAKTLKSFVSDWAGLEEVS